MTIIFCFFGSIAILAPWVITGTGRRVIAGMSPAFVATYAWMAYELAVGPKPASRLDLIILVPLFAFVCISGLASMVIDAALDEMRNLERKDAGRE